MVRDTTPVVTRLYEVEELEERKGESTKIDKRDAHRSRIIIRGHELEGDSR